LSESLLSDRLLMIRDEEPRPKAQDDRSRRYERQQLTLRELA
jgi:hypothetical protein